MGGKASSASAAPQEGTVIATKSKRRKSWFRLSRVPRPPSTIDDSRIPTLDEQLHQSSNNNGNLPPSAWQDPEERLRPIQFAPNRIQTLYVTKSERDLYLAAMSQLDRAPPPLPLWMDPAPALPGFTIPLNPLTPPSLPDRSINSNSNCNHMRSMSEGTGYSHPLTSRPLSPKLVTSPQMGRSGLMVRDEFKRTDPPKVTRHALMALTPPASIRLTGFPVSLISALDVVLQENWMQGVAGRSHGAEALQDLAGNEGDGFTWKVELEGKVWKRKGSEELDSIRLLLAILSILGIHGWTLVQSVQAGGSKKDAHNLLFAYAQETSVLPPLFFALSIPLPDRLSLISAPPKCTPAIISALRDAVISNSPKNHSRIATGATGVTVGSSDSNGSVRATNGGEAGARTKSPKVKWKGYDPRGIKLEGWVHDGVYRFWIDGMRRWLGGRVKRRLVENLHPNLLIAIINNITALHFQLAASMPLLPIVKGRDILIFQSLPASGLSVRDTFVPRPPNQAPSVAGTESPVLVSPAASLPAHEVLEAQAHGNITNHDPREVNPDNRKLPWASILTDRNQRTNDTRAPSPSKASQPPSSAARLEKLGSTSRRRTPSQESRKPLLGGGGGMPAAPSASANSTPRHKNVLLKKNSLSRRRSVSGNNVSRNPSEDGHGRHSSQGHHNSTAGPIATAGDAGIPMVGFSETRQPIDDGSVHSRPTSQVFGQCEDHRHFIITNPDKVTRDNDEWSFIDPPPNVGKLGVTMFDAAQPSHMRRAADGGPLSHDGVVDMPATGPAQYDSLGRASGEETAESGQSIYADAHAHHPSPEQPHYAHTHITGSPGKGNKRSSVPSVDVDIPNSKIPPIQVIPMPLATTSSGEAAETSDSELDIGAGSELDHAHPLTQPLALGQPINARDRQVDSPVVQQVNMVGVEDSPQRRGRQQGKVEMSVNSVHGSVQLENRSRIPEPQINIIASTPTSSNNRHVSLRAKTDEHHPTPPRLPARPTQAIQADLYPSQAHHGGTGGDYTYGDDDHEPASDNGNENEVLHNRNKYLDWEQKDKLKEGMIRRWDAEREKWRDCPAGSSDGGVGAGVAGNGRRSGHGNGKRGAGSSRTKVSLR
ncbi:hypothetical protein I316_06140 [Kwoniella heveanensis BCC8398]|uniref:Uncharacterized protein n=1 Tax=Kwoniella heveanensis BCC8398 TaxID=1296120 RepID=A0A1B9GMI1_9TREE|nr:hypothetical protein I316_06140 [Kwoniella heveanensis BCC8398]